MAALCYDINLSERALSSDLTNHSDCILNILARVKKKLLTRLDGKNIQRSNESLRSYAPKWLSAFFSPDKYFSDESLCSVSLFH